MNKFIRHVLYWVGAGMAVLLFLYWLMPAPRDNPYMKILYRDGGGFDGCEFSGDGKSEKLFRFKMTAEECRFVNFDKGSVQFAVDYPQSKIVRNGWKGNELPIFFYLERISMDGYDANRHVAGKAPVHVADGIESYEVAGVLERKFLGTDNAPVYVSDFVNTSRARRIYKDGVRVFYQYPRELGDVRAVDVFVVDVLDKILVE